MEIGNMRNGTRAQPSPATGSASQPTSPPGAEYKVLSTYSVVKPGTCIWVVYLDQARKSITVVPGQATDLTVAKICPDAVNEIHCDY